MIDCWARKYVRIIFGIDATKLRSYPQFQFKFLDTIFFTYPHVGNSDRGNALLLRGFFQSAAKLLRASGQVCIVLLKCKCQREEAHKLAVCAGFQVRSTTGQSFNWNNIRQPGKCQYTPRDCFGKKWVPLGESLTYVYEKW